MFQPSDSTLTPENLSEFIRQQEIQLAEQADQIELVIYWSIIPLLILFVFLFFVVYRSRREAAFRKREFDLQLARSAMEMRALRSQVNPHFIFNCLASIQNFVAKNDNKEAEYYLVRFSGLIRQVLENSTEKMVSIADDLDALEKYVEMEKLRLNQGFDFTLLVDVEIDQEETFIPPLIIQPLVENAIWHGVNGGDEKGVIEVELKLADDSGIECTVRNNVVEVMKDRDSSKKKSLGLSLIRERIDLLNSLYHREDHLEIRDVENSYFHKEVRMVIPCEFE